jgi:hypothetical protein
MTTYLLLGPRHEHADAASHDLHDRPAQLQAITAAEDRQAPARQKADNRDPGNR